ncbi:hypothetical protein CRI77_08825 [Mycolicibacterium duvalii]|uniref:Uncharacterized protein n=1 Tax=Mycolicibacterium duvalii TaxID=39688 RepID=A0A7I7JY22_9MYCO|nr:hypothetical protein [Mycolicibacterium duvalii]MCV7369507.1 hypothetical protein [Mycolicibacterium duvalii]PEG42145.1 hypothetical protein CRI77_08825 [Mycolicibacterium duvalii]BBX16228.1 hypothetical protein MDUV_10880 [Mycolicibacterium duvalii]
MRIAVLLALGLLTAACSQSVGGQAESSSSVTSDSAAPPSVTSASPTVSPPSAARPAVPADDASIAEVISWVEDGAPADPAGFHVAFRDGVTTELGDEVAFTASAGTPLTTTQCVTDQALLCLLELDDPPPRPAGAEGAWKPGWISYPGTSVQVGSLRADPGPFGAGSGPRLDDGQSLAFGDNRCRADTAALICVNYAHRTAVRLSAEGVIPYGCLQPAPTPPDAAALYRC